MNAASPANDEGWTTSAGNSAKITLSTAECGKKKNPGSTKSIQALSLE
jgi:hypothetical protein